MIAAGLLLDLKVTLGGKRPDGTRRLSLDKAEVYQLVGYALLDFDDTYRINEVGIFSARYAYLATWPLTGLLEELASHPIDLVERRTQFEHLLRDLREQELAARAVTGCPAADEGQKMRMTALIMLAGLSNNEMLLG